MRTFRNLLTAMTCLLTAAALATAAGPPAGGMDMGDSDQAHLD